MIDYMKLASDAGFGGVLRRTMASRIKTLVDLAIQQERLACADLCTLRADEYKEMESDEFRDGQMDGSYQCAEMILKRK